MTALQQLDDEYARWICSLDADGLARPCGTAEGLYADHPMSVLVLHINREVIHHGAEMALLRDLYVHTNHDINTRRSTDARNAPHPPTASARRSSSSPRSTRMFFSVAHGLTDEQAWSTPSVSAPSIGGLIKHAAFFVQRGCGPSAPRARPSSRRRPSPVRGADGRIPGSARHA